MSESATAPRVRTDLPESIRRQVARAAELHAEAYAVGSEGGADGEGAGDEPAGPAPGTEGAGASLTPDATGADGVPAAAGVPAAPAPDPQAPVDWEHRYNSLKGKHDQTLARLSALEGVLASMETAPTPAGGPGVATPVVTPELDFAPLTAEEREDFGDFVSVAERAAAARFLPLIADLKNQVEQLKGTVGRVETRAEVDAKTEAMTYLANEVPDFPQLNTDPGFLGWLQGLDRFSRQPRQVLLNAAVAANDGPSIAAFFLAYKDEIGATRAAPSPSTDPARGAPPAPARTSLETLAGPGRGRPGTPNAGSPGSAGDTPAFRQSEVKAFYADVRRGAFKGREAEKARIEAQIVAAAGAGRIMAG